MRRWLAFPASLPQCGQVDHLGPIGVNEPGHFPIEGGELTLQMCLCYIMGVWERDDFWTRQSEESRNPPRPAPRQVVELLWRGAIGPPCLPQLKTAVVYRPACHCLQFVSVRWKACKSPSTKMRQKCFISFNQEILLSLLRGYRIKGRA